MPDQGNTGVTTTPEAGAIRPPNGCGVLTLDSLDKRTRPYRRYVTIRDAIIGDLGGADLLSEVQRQMVSKFATMAMQLEAMEAEAAQGEEIDLDLFARIAGHMRRLGETLGVQRRPRDAVPDLATYLRENYATEAAD